MLERVSGGSSSKHGIRGSIGAQQEGGVAVKRTNFQHVPERLLQETKHDAGLVQPVAVPDEITVEPVHDLCLTAQSQSLRRNFLPSSYSRAVITLDGHLAPMLPDTAALSIVLIRPRQSAGRRLGNRARHDRIPAAQELKQPLASGPLPSCAWLGRELNCRLRSGWGRYLRRKGGVTFWEQQCL